MVQRAVEENSPFLAQERFQSTEIMEENDLDRSFSAEELKRALSCIRKNSAPGLDGIEYKMIWLLPIGYIKVITDIFSEFFRSNNTSDEWRQYQVIFIDKVGKDKVRPILLSSCFGKIYERLLNERLNWWAEHNDIYDKCQNGFRRGKSCLENVVRLTVNVRTAKFKNQCTMASFLDVSNAYDNVIYGILIKKMIDMKCPFRLINAISNWLYYREVSFTLEDNELIKRTVYRGLPQGAVLSPLLYNLYTCDISNGIPREVSYVQFVDDIAIWYSDSKTDRCKFIIESAMDGLYTELGKIGLDLQPSKTNIVEFDMGLGTPRFHKTVRCINENLSVMREAKFLDITFDYKLNFDSQCRNVKERVVRINSLFRYMNKVSWGMEVNTALLLYKSMLRSIIHYGSMVYVPNNDNKSRVTIERAQFAGIRTALGYRNSTPTCVMVAEAKVTSIRERAKVLAKNFSIKNIVQGEQDLMRELKEGVCMEVKKNMLTPWRSYTVLTDALLKCVKHGGILNKFDRCPIFNVDYWDATNPLVLDLEIGIEYESLRLQKKSIVDSYRKKYQLDKQSYVIYTDGSRTKGSLSTGNAFYVDALEVGFYVSIDNHCNSYTAEACAISEALKWCKMREVSEDILVLTDSRSVLCALSSNKISAYINEYILEIRKRYFELSRKVIRESKKIIIGWIPAHKRIYGNEVADKLAKEATLDEPCRELKVPLKDMSKKTRD